MFLLPVVSFLVAGLLVVVVVVVVFGSSVLDLTLPGLVFVFSANKQRRKQIKNNKRRQKK